jgi:hypothetical protein
MTTYQTFQRKATGYNLPGYLYGGNSVAPAGIVTYTCSPGPGEVLGFGILKYGNINYFFNKLGIRMKVDDSTLFDGYARDIFGAYLNLPFHNHIATLDIQVIGSVNFLAYDNTHWVQSWSGGGGVLTADSHNQSTWETFTIIDNGDGTVSLLCYDGIHYWYTANGGGSTVDATGTSVTNYTKFTIADTGDGYIGFLCYDGVHYLSAVNGGGAGMTAQYSAYGTWERFKPYTYTDGLIACSYRYKIPYESSFELRLTNNSAFNQAYLAGIYFREGG